MPTRRNRRCASPQRASFSSVPPPQNCSFLPPPAAVTVLPPPGHARIPSVERHSAGTCSPTPEILRPDGLRMTGKQCHPEHQRYPSGAREDPVRQPERFADSRRWPVTPRTRVRPVDICCDSACAPGAVRPAPTLRSAYVSLHTRLGAGPSRLARVCGRSTSAATQHVRPALCAQRPRFAPHMSPCTHGSALDLTLRRRRAQAAPAGVPARRGTQARRRPARDEPRTRPSRAGCIGALSAAAPARSAPGRRPRP